MYHFFTLLYISLIGIKINLLSTFGPLQLGQRVLDLLIVCGPAACLLVEFYSTGDTTLKREQHRPFIQVFDMILQLLFVIKVVSGLYRGDSARLVADYLKSRLLIGPSPYA
jgi:hypothetical protein